LNSSKTTGTLYLIPAPLGISEIKDIIPTHVNEITCELTEFIAEDARTARRYLKTAGYTKPFDDIVFHILNKYTRDEEIPDFLNSLLKGNNVGLLSEAGIPCIADPGAAVVKMAHQFTIKVVPLTGPSSIFLALSASGMNGQNFVFHGYLPIDKNERKKKIKEIENTSYIKDQTQIFIETPYRNKQMFDEIVNSCKPQTMLCIARDITLSDEFIKTMTVGEWRSEPPELNKKNTVFLIYKG
jgi:16S rRNA (cytidine1402-2'-O)-methyltransferase